MLLMDIDKPCPICKRFYWLSEVKEKTITEKNGVVIKIYTYLCCGDVKEIIALPHIRKKTRRGTKVKFSWYGFGSLENVMKIVDHRTRIKKLSDDKYRWEKKKEFEFDEHFDTIDESKKFIEDKSLFKKVKKEKGDIVEIEGQKCEIIPLWSYFHEQINPDEINENLELWHKHNNFNWHPINRKHKGSNNEI
jgi:signal peptidase I